MSGSGAAIRRLNVAMTIVVCTATVAIPYWLDRAYRRWWDANRPLAPFGTRLRQVQTRYRARQEALIEEAGAAVAVAIAIAASVPPARRQGEGSSLPSPGM